MKVQCIEPGKNLTVGKEYEVIKAEFFLYCIRNDKGELSLHSQWKFRKADDKEDLP